MISLRVMTAEDIPAGLLLCRMIGWNQLARDWQQFLQASPGECRVAIKDNKVVGTVATIKYQKAFCWIGMVLVDPVFQKQGIGKGLLHEALKILHNEETIKLDATPAGKEVYLKVGFADEYKISRMNSKVADDFNYNTDARQLEATEVSAIADFDKPVFGADRKFMLQWMYEGFPDLAFVVIEKQEIIGYCMGRKGFNFTHIGPVVAEDIETAKQLVVAAMRKCKGSTVVIDALQYQPAWEEWLSSIGFTVQRELIRMYKGANNFPGETARQFAILGPEFG